MEFVVKLCFLVILCAKCSCNNKTREKNVVVISNATSKLVTDSNNAISQSGNSVLSVYHTLTRPKATKARIIKRAEESKLLKRTRRYLTFPEGSTFSFAFCMTVKVLTPDDPDIFSEAVALATSYDLPNNTRALGLFPEDEKAEATKLSRRQRSYVYNKAEKILDKLGFAGRDCVLRTICEGAQQLSPADNVLTEVLRVILSFPEDHSSPDEPKEQWVYLGAYKAGLGNYNCPDLYPTCSVSFVTAIMSLRPIA